MSTDTKYYAVSKGLIATMFMVLTFAVGVVTGYLYFTVANRCVQTPFETICDGTGVRK